MSSLRAPWHDAIEKTAARAAELRKQFGQQITSLVLAVTENARIADYEERKAALREQVAATGDPALMVFAADKISKVRESRLQPTSTPQPNATIVSLSRERHFVHHYECLRMLERLLDSTLVAQLRAEIETLPVVLAPESLLVGAAGS